MANSTLLKTTFLIALGAFVVTGIRSQEQVFNFIEMGVLPDEIPESSGLAVAGEGSFWTHNDRGGKPLLFEVDLRGELIRTVKLIGADATDYEELTQDDQGNLYLGDFGNNKKDRSTLSIYKIPTNAIKAKKNPLTEEISFQVTPEKIEFLLPDNGLNSKCHYDFEAMIWNNGQLVLFTKDRCDDPDNVTRIYALPDIPGHYTAEDKGYFGWEDAEKAVKITSADLSWDGKKLILLSKDAIHIFFAFKKDRYFEGSYRYIPTDKTKKDAICHLGDCDLYISEETTKDKPGRLLKINLCQVEID